MKPSPFQYVQANGVESALKFSMQSNAVKFVAAGQSLGPMLNLRLVQPEVLVDITAIEDLKRAHEGRVVVLPEMARDVEGLDALERIASRLAAGAASSN